MSKTIFITGSSSGLGRATAILFSERGWNVIATMRNPERERELQGLRGVTLLPLDVADPAQIERAAEAALALGPVDVVFANAGYALGGPLEGASDAQIEREVATNLLGPIRTIRPFLAHFRARGSGVFLLTGSTTGYAGMPFLSVYSATKFALEGFAEALSHELALYGVRVKTIVPGAMKTDALQRSREVAEHPAYADQVAKALHYYVTSAERVSDGDPAQVAELVFAAATDDKDQVAYFVTEEARQFEAARAQLGAEGLRRQLREMLSAS